MGSFINGSDSVEWQERFCLGCFLGRPKKCPIIMLHGLYNHKQHDKGNDDLRAALNLLIPVTADGRNGTCSMYTAARRG